MTFFKCIITTLILFLTMAASHTAGAFEKTISVSEAVICQGVSNLTPEAPGDIFPGDIGTLYCYSVLSSSDNTTIKHVWYKDEQIAGEIDLQIGISTGWRTFSSKKIPYNSPGNWKVEILSEKGDLLKSVLFVVN